MITTATTGSETNTTDQHY